MDSSGYFSRSRGDRNSYGGIRNKTGNTGIHANIYSAREGSGSGERYGLITTSTTAYRVTLETEGGNDVTVRPNRQKCLQFPAVGKSVTLTYESTDEGGRLITNILEVRNGN